MQCIGGEGGVTDRIDYDEFGLFDQNATEYGLPFDTPPVVRREFVEVAPGRRLSALVWKDAQPGGTWPGPRRRPRRTGPPSSAQ